MTKNLNSHRKQIIEQAGTEAAGTGALLHNDKSGEYVCGKCGQVLFLSDHKFDSNSGWPSFYDIASSKAVMLVADSSHGMERVEARCSKCSGHLGHVFDDAVGKPGGKRYCINSASLDFKDKNGAMTSG